MLNQTLNLNPETLQLPAHLCELDVFRQFVLKVHQPPVLLLELFGSQGDDSLVL